MRACVAPVCDFKSEVEVVTHKGIIEPCWGNVKEGTFRKYKKNARVENSAGERLYAARGRHKPGDTHRQSRWEESVMT